MLRLFLEALGEYYNAVHTSSIKDINLGENLDDRVTKIIENKFEIQESITIVEK